MRQSFLLVACVSCFSASVFAYDFVLADPITFIDEEVDWSGFYAGIFAGRGTGTVRTVGAASGAATEVGVGGNLVGLTLGANMQHGAFVLGFEGDVLWSGMSGRATCASVPAYDCNGRVDWLGSLRGRAGYGLDRVMVFASAGVAAGGGPGTVTPTFPGTTSSFSDTYAGWTVGGGMEVLLSKAMSIKVDYSYYDLGTRQAPAGTLGTQAFDVRPVVHAVKIGMNVHF